MNEERLCELAMLHVHRNDTVVQEKPEAVLKRFDRVAIGNSILHSPTKYCHLRLFIRPKKNICVFTATCQKNLGSVGRDYFFFYYRQNRK
jgi:hypothetical protein